MANGAKPGRPGNHIHCVALLNVGQVHSISRPFMGEKTNGPLSDSISNTRRKLARFSSALYGRVTERMPERRYTVNTGVLVADNQVYVTAVIERVA